MSTTPALPADRLVNLRQYLEVLRARRLQVALITLGVVAASLVYTFLQPVTYVAEARVLVESAQNSLLTPVNNPQAVQPNMDNEKEVLRSEAVAAEARAKLGLSSGTPLGSPQVSVLPNTFILIVQSGASSPEGAAALANAFAQAYIDHRRDQLAGQLDLAVDAIEEQVVSIDSQLSELDRRIVAAPNRTEERALEVQRGILASRLGLLQQRLVDLQVAASATRGGTIIKGAQPPLTPASPDKLKNGILGLLGGLALGVLGALFLEGFSDRVRGSAELERSLGAPVMARIPREGRRRGPEVPTLLTDPRAPVSEAYRTLATNLLYAATLQGSKAFLVTSAVRGEGKSTVSANLSLALASTGRKVVLVSADLRIPHIHELFGLAEGAGMSDVLAKGVHPALVLQESGVPGLQILPTGPVPLDPVRLLAGGWAGELFKTLREITDFVIVDTPPVLGPADASIVARLVDAVVFVVDPGRAGRSALARARDQLTNAGAKIVGVVHNRLEGGEVAISYPSSPALEGEREEVRPTATQRQVSISSLGTAEGQGHQG